MNIGKVSSGKNIAFGGYQKVLDDRGFNKFKFFYPYDSSKYTCEVCLYDIEQERDTYPIVAKKPRTRILLDEKGSSPLVNIDDLFAEAQSGKFAYRFEFKDRKKVEEAVSQGKDASEVEVEQYAFDPGMVTNILLTKETKDPGRNHTFSPGEIDSDPKNKFNIVVKDRISITKDGKMELIMPDEYYPGIERAEDGKYILNEALRAKALASVRTHINKLGGTMNGIASRLPELEKEGFTRIVGMPLTKDTISSHLYWTQNAYQVAPQLGSMDDYRNLNVEMYKHGMNWVADAALVNEGFEGIHLSNVLRWGKESPFFNWFRINSNSLMMGVLPQNDKHSSYRLVNSPFVLNKDGSTVKNQDYDSKKPTYVQMYDKRMASEKQLASSELILTYDRNNTDNTYDIADHDDVVYPYYYEINPKRLLANIDNYKKEHKDVKDYYSPQALVSLLQFENFRVDKKAEGGIVSWDGNVDIAKLNFADSHKDQQIIDMKDITPQEKAKMKAGVNRGVLEVQDYAVISGRYWTKLVSDSIVAYTAQTLGRNIDSPEAAKYAIEKAIKEGKLPKAAKEKMTDDVIKNVYSNSYKLNISRNYPEKADACIEKMLMDVPLETLPFANNLLGTLTSAYIAKRAKTQEQIGLSRFDFNKSCKDTIPEEFRATYDKMDEVYQKHFQPVAKEVLAQLGFKAGANGRLSVHGIYVANDILPEIAQYLFVKSLFPDADIRFKGGHLDLSHVDQEACSINALKIYANSPDEEAKKLMSKLMEGASKLGSKEIEQLVYAYSPRISKTSEMSYKLADVIVDRTESGLGWRIDASKDIASIDAVKEETEPMDSTFERVIAFWKHYTKAVQKVNPHAYTVSEITDLPNKELFGNSGKGRFLGADDAELKYTVETNAGGVANYTYFFSTLLQLVSPDAEKGEISNFNSTAHLLEGMAKGWCSNPGFLFQLPLDSIINSYTFVGNHDKPRILHCLGIDMALFHSDFKDKSHREAAAEVLGKDEKDINFADIKGPAIAMGKQLRLAFAKSQVLSDSDIENALDNFDKNQSVEKALEGVQYLAQGDKDAIISSVKDAQSLKNALLEKQLFDDEAKAKIYAAITSMANGEYRDNKRKQNAEVFGTRPFDVAIREVLLQAGLTESYTDSSKSKLEAETLRVMLEPAFDKYYTVYKTLITLPGAPTDFAGDKVGATGYETKAKNCFQQNRNPIRWEWLDDPQRAYVKKYYDNINSILDLRNKPELSALNDGTPVVLPNIDSEGNKVNDKQLSVLRYNDRGSMVITTYAPHGASKTPGLMDRMDIALDNILLNSSAVDLRQSGLKTGLKEGTKFKNANSSDTNVYVVKKSDESDDYYLVNEGGDKKIHIKPEDYNSLVLYKID